MADHATKLYQRNTLARALHITALNGTVRSKLGLQRPMHMQWLGNCTHECPLFTFATKVKKSICHSQRHTGTHKTEKTLFFALLASAQILEGHVKVKLGCKETTLVVV